MRFFERAIITQIACPIGSSGGAASQDSIDIGPMLADPAGEFEAAQLAVQPDLRKDGVDFMPAIQYRHDISRGDAFQDLIPTVAQIAGDDHPHQNVGFHDQYRARCSAFSALVI